MPSETTVTNVLIMADPRQVRAWAQTNGFSLGERGRIPREIMAAFQAKQAELTAVNESNQSITEDKLSISELSENNDDDIPPIVGEMDA
jgi:hypothetical protein